MDIIEAIRCIIDGEAVLFTGSGFSKYAKNEDGNYLCTAKDLAHKMLKDCGFDEADYIDDLGQASDIYQETKGPFDLLRLLKKEFTAVELTDEQKLIASLPWFRIYTTNYDNVLEKAFQDNGKHLNTAVLSDRQADFHDNNTLCVCLNGSLSRSSVDKLNDEIKLTDRSYLTNSFMNSNWLNFFQTDLKTAKAVFFVGYSMLYDLDIQRIMFSSDELKNKTFFILWENEPKANRLLINKFGDAQPIGLTGFAKKIKDVQSNYVAVKNDTRPLLCFDKVDVNKNIPTIKDKDAFDLFIKGNYGTYEKLFYSIKSPDYIQFCVFRTKLESVIKAVRSGEKNIMIHSSLGNGKTLFLLSLSTLFSNNGYKVFFYQQSRNTFAREIESICKEYGPVVVVFDQYSDCLSHLETFRNFRNDQIIVLADRSALNDINYYKVSSWFGEFNSFDLNRLEDTEIKQLCKILSRYGLWGDKSHYRDDQKEEFIAYDCKRSIAQAILAILHSNNIIEKYTELIDDIKNHKGFYNAIIYVLIAQVAEFNVDTDDLVNLFDASQLNSPSFKNNTSVKEFINFDGCRIKGTSSLFAQVLLQEVIKSSDIIIDVMLDIYKKLNNLRSRQEVRQVLRKMTNYSNLQHILNKDDKRYKENLKYYYDSIHTLSFCAENPYFWLQYAILMLSEYNYTTAEIYFNNAYSFARKQSGFDTYQIDNHHARFLLEHEMQFGSPATCMRAFMEAHQVLMNPKHKVDSLFYPYRVAQKYYNFYLSFFERMTKPEKETFIAACEKMLERVEWYLNLKTVKSLEGRNAALNARNNLTKILSDRQLKK